METIEASNAEEIDKRVCEKEETLRKLQMVKLHRSKHDTGELQDLINQWLSVCQQALQDLEKKLKELSPNPDGASMENILKNLGIEAEAVCYSVEDETFTL